MHRCLFVLLVCPGVAAGLAPNALSAEPVTIKSESDSSRMLALSPDGAQIVDIGSDQTRVYDTSTGQLLDQWVHRNTSSDRGLEQVPVVFSRDGKLMASYEVRQDRPATARAAIRIRTVSDHQVRHSILVGPSITLRWMSFSPDGSVLAVCGTGMIAKDVLDRRQPGNQVFPMIQMWDVETGKSVGTLEGRIAELRQPTSSPDGTTLVGNTTGLAVEFWDIRQNKIIRTRKPSAANRFAYSPDGSRLTMVFIGGNQLGVTIWDLRTDRVVATVQETFLDTYVEAVELSADGSAVAAADTTHEVTVWDTLTGKVRGTFQAPRSPLPVGLALSDTASKIAVATSLGTIKIWDLDDKDSAVAIKSAENPFADKQAQPAAPLRTWTSANGDYQVEAKLVEVLEGAVLLAKEDGKQIRVEIDKLSAADREFIRSKQEVKKSEDASPTDVVARIRELGGRVTVEGEKVTEVDLYGAEVSDDDLVLIKGLSDLELLDVSGTRITDEGLAHLKDLPSLKTLVLTGSDATGDELAKLRGRQLEVILSEPQQRYWRTRTTSQAGKMHYDTDGFSVLFEGIPISPNFSGGGSPNFSAGGQLAVAGGGRGSGGVGFGTSNSDQVQIENNYFAGVCTVTVFYSGQQHTLEVRRNGRHLQVNDDFHFDLTRGKKSIVINVAGEAKELAASRQRSRRSRRRR